jgi:hypothetical protein
MTTKYNIGTLNEANLQAKGFLLSSDNVSLQNCIKGTKTLYPNDKYVAMLSSATAIDPLQITGKCYRGVNYNPKIDVDDTTGILFDIYAIPADECNTVRDCLISNSKKILDDELKEIEAEKYDVQIRLYAIQHELPYATAQQKLKDKEEQDKLDKQLTELNKRKEMLEAHKISLSARNSEASILLADKNKLLATVNSNIQQKYTKLEHVNNKINTITQDIYTNNMEMKRKENIIQTLKVIIIIVVLMAVVLMVYFGMDIVEKKYPNAINNMINNYNKNFLN